MDITKNILVWTFYLFFMISLIASCGYKDKNECIVKEQQKGDGASRGDVIKYCNNLFKKNKTSFFSKETRLEKDKDYVAKSVNGILSVTNYSEHTINIVKIVASDITCDGKIEPFFKWDDQINYIAGSSIPSGWTEKIVDIGDSDCYYMWVGYK